MYLVVFFLLLWTLYHSIICQEICMEPNPEENALYILQTTDNKLRNDQFIKSLNVFVTSDKDNLYPKPKILTNCSSMLWETIGNTRELRYVVNLHVTDFYQNSYDEMESNGFLYAGDIEPYTPGTEIEVCKRNFQKPNDACKSEKVVLQKDVKVVSKEVMSIPFLYDLVYNFENPEIDPRTEFTTQVNYTIIICSKIPIEKRHIQRTFNDVVKMVTYFSDKCNTQLDNVNHNIIAVLAPNENSIEETIKPVIFYEDALYRNSDTRQRLQWLPLADALLQFIMKMDWNRVAVLSDGSVESDAFEVLLRELFAKHGVAHEVITVVETNHQYNFSKALKVLRRDKARIIIANVDEKNIQFLVNQAHNDEMIASRNLLWIARSLSNDKARTAAKDLNDALYLYREPTPVHVLIRGINRVIHKSYLNTNSSYDFGKHTQFAKDILEELQKLKEVQNKIIHIKRIKAPGDKIIATYNKGVVTLKQNFLKPDTRGDCVLLSSNYYKPCNTAEIIYFMMVIAVAAVTVLGITVFFETPDSQPDVSKINKKSTPNVKHNNKDKVPTC